MTVEKLVVKNALRVVAVDAIRRDPSYQRDVRPGHRKIVADFNQEAFGVVLVGERADGSLWIVDGLQRLTAAGKLKLKKIRAEVFASRGPEHEAQVFGLINGNRTRLSGVEQFNARLTAGDETAWAVKDAVEAAGFRLGSTGPADKTVGCAAALYRLVRLRGAAPLTFALDTVKRAWPGDPQAFKDAILMGLGAYFVDQDETVDADKFVRQLATTTPAKVLYSANMGIGGREANVLAVLHKLARKRVRK